MEAARSLEQQLARDHSALLVSGNIMPARRTRGLAVAGFLLRRRRLLRERAYAADTPLHSAHPLPCGASCLLLHFIQGERLLGGILSTADRHGEFCRGGGT